MKKKNRKQKQPLTAAKTDVVSEGGDKFVAKVQSPVLDIGSSNMLSNQHAEHLSMEDEA